MVRINLFLMLKYPIVYEYYFSSYLVYLAMASVVFHHLNSVITGQTAPLPSRIQLNQQEQQQTSQNTDQKPQPAVEVEHRAETL